MTFTAALVRRTYYGLSLGNTLAASLIWGVNTLFLLDAGLNNFQAFAANAFFTAGMVIFEVPTGIVADWWGRRASYLLGTVTLGLTTVLYLWLWRLDGPFWAWAVSSALIGLGFTFFSGATEAWLVDALRATGYSGGLDAVFARGQVFTGAGMLVGAASGGYLAQFAGLGAPYLLRACVLAVMFVLAAVLMRDIGFTSVRGAGFRQEIRDIAGDSVRFGLRVRPVRWLMLAAPFTGGVTIYVWYALQPYLLDLWGDSTAYGIVGLTAALLAAAQIVGGLVTPFLRRVFIRRTSILLVTLGLNVVAVLLIGLIPNFWAVLVLVVLWGLVGASAMPVRQAYLNGMIPSRQRATILSFDSLMASAGGVVSQPLLGRSADVWGYPFSYVLSAGLSALALPFVWLSRRERDPADIRSIPEATPPG
ncbi:MFS transporter [Amorphoplanes digitatis]|uniref:MFS family permease n=1 Tax=Actinoplanes digitatis TaxID=1868 RepID=A0A7W7I3P2_9ACTN|nr:MFS transporter [Actinoplanes digitatis]MBB4765879.1 MFS family permease [Actinoplanes digitatis]GID93329.1 MFS transporter [Actinoplanes digitatis]